MADKAVRGRARQGVTTESGWKPYLLILLEGERGVDFAAEAGRLLREGVALKRIARDWGISEPTARRYLRLSGERWRRQWVADGAGEG